MRGNKEWYQSKTIQGVITALLVYLAKMMELGIDEATITGTVYDVLAIISLIYAIYGRYVASRRIK